MKGLIPRLALFSFAVALVLTVLEKKDKAVTPTQQPHFPTPPVVQVARALPDKLPYFTAVATLEGSTETEVHARVAGYLVRQDYQEGASVRQGDLLFEMDSRSFLAAIEQAKAKLAEKQAHSTSRAEVDAAQAALNTAQQNLADTKILAPAAGIVGGAIPGLGDWIGPQMPLTTISTVDPIKAVFALPKDFYQDHSDQIAEILALSPQARPETLELILADGSRYPRQGHWDSVDVAMPNSNRPITIYALFPNPDLVLRPGQYVRVSESKL